ncbi:acyltransferase [Sphingobium sp. PAMC28499]|jgi:peptidoglycan/LPS O-acetylase OafA/YrhL|uniref:acyltransferase family protein n=1 Tax=Sphingobium sp. PAMC28499 TaxID=2565554 RepID=UPI00109DEC74|nr:acyltransferase [Sphingobium sp. PAMC28499]QCB38939.1 acyltransferase [Sphingobium sp. PAMC28499]
MSPGRHIPALDGIRGFAALLVVFCHFRTFGYPELLHPRAGDYGVLLFFTLSGFLMGHLYLPRTPDRDALASYAAARIARIVPLYACVSLLSFLIYRFVYADFIYPIGLIELVRQGTFTSTVSVFWSIGPEFQFYFLFPAIWAATYAKQPLRGWLYVLIGLIVAGCYAASPWLPGIFALAKMHIFMTGILCAVLVRQIPEDRMTRLFPPLLLFTAAFIWVLIAPPASVSAWVFPPVTNDPKHIIYYADPLKIVACALVILGTAIRHPFNDMLWGNPLMRRLGAYSFSLYLLHMPILQLVRLAGPAWGISMPMQILIATILSLAVAGLSNEMFERPVGNWVRRKLTDALNGHAATRPLPLAAESPSS